MFITVIGNDIKLAHDKDVSLSQGMNKCLLKDAWMTELSQSVPSLTF